MSSDEDNLIKITDDTAETAIDAKPQADVSGDEKPKTEKPDIEPAADGQLKPTENSTSAEPSAPIDSPTTTQKKPPTPPPKDDTEDAPPPPPRPASPFTQAINTLKEAFPEVDSKVVRAIVVASQGNMDSAFNGMLALNDDSFKPESIYFDASARLGGAGGAPGLPGRPGPRDSGSERRQIEEDEALARKLAQEFDRRGSRASSGRRDTGRDRNRDRDHVYNHGQYRRPEGGRYSGTNYSGRYDDDRPEEPERSFFDDDLTEIRDSLQKGFEETKEKVSGWMTNLRKRIDGDGTQPGLFGNSLGNSSTSAGRYSQSPRDSYDDRSGMPRSEMGNGRRRMYDNDHSEIGDDFQGIRLRDETDYEPPRMPSRRSQQASNRPRAVSALGDEPDSPPAEVKPSSATRDSAANKNSKWEPLSTVAPEPTDKDAFFIGDSDEDEDEVLSTKK